MKEKIEIMDILQNKQILENELKNYHMDLLK